MKTSEIRELSLSELQEKIETAKAELLKAKINHAVSPVEDTTTLKKARKDIARMMTILRERQTTL